MSEAEAKATRATQGKRTLSEINAEIAALSKLLPTIKDSDEFNRAIKAHERLMAKRDKLTGKDESLSKGNGQTRGACKREIIGVYGSEVVIQPVRWLWKWRFAYGKFSILTGLPDTGKGHTLIHLAATITTGGFWPDGSKSDEGGVIFLSQEEGMKDTTLPRLIAAGANVDRCFFITGVRIPDDTGTETPTNFRLGRDMDRLAEAIEKMRAEKGVEVRLIVIDPMSSYFGVVKTNEDTPVRALLDPLGQFAECHNVCVLGVMHYNKNVAALDADDRISGNTAFKQAARSIWHVIADASNKHRRLFLPGKGNNLKKGDGTAYGMAFSFVSVVLENGEEYSKIAWEAEAIAMTATEYLRANSAERCGDRLEAAVQFLSDLLASRPLKSVDVENKYMEKGFSQRTIERASKDLSIKRYPIREGGKLVWFWKLPSDEKVSLPNEKKVSLPNDLADLLSPMIHKEKNDDFELVCQVNLERGDEKIEHLKTAIETDTLIDI